ncbi:S1C family serine protease [Actinokineospora bangkokensis]|uniref:Protease n=1 Tax=Actinokineospora bangkokensis TaxID=1193682 RepID=A0A1Q9LD42_9PSEU|nr:trypsin-like peptidase domain-containing protein [Actinokineospora bangkokensis]OLR89933.1 protease [Actinokineospora bangkokensis]
MTENEPDSGAGKGPGDVDPWSARAAAGAAGAHGAAADSGEHRASTGEQGPGRLESGPPAGGEQGPTAPGAGYSAPEQQHWSPWSAQGSGTGADQTAAFGSTPGSAHDTGAHQQVLYGSAAPHPGYAGQPVANPYQQQHTGQLPQQPQQRRRGAGGLVAGMAVLALLVGGAAGAAGGYLVASDNSSGGTGVSALDTPPTAQQSASAPAGSVESVAQKVLPSVVQLQVRGQTAAGEGSGFVISSDGLIVTNNHVVEPAAQGGQIQAVFQNGKTATATVVGRDPTSDVAVVRAQGVSGLTVAELGRSDDLKVGQEVVAIGSPFELAGTVTSGIVSSLNRPTRAGGENGSQATVLDAIQTDAAINPGNSGGPLVNMAGQIIGINSAIYSPTSSASTQGGSVGIGFAIPINQARRTADEIVKTGKATQTVLGVSVRDNPNGQGALIAEVVGGGAGQAAGLKQGDVVTQLDDRRIDDADALVAAVRSHAPNDKVTLTVDGNNQVEATLGGQPVDAN